MSDDPPVVSDTLQLERRLGRGGGGEVWLARSVPLDAPVAVKILIDASDAQMRERFALEARGAARIQHPHVVRIFDYGMSPDGYPFIVMEYLRGQDLGARLQSGPLAVAETLAIIAQASLAIDAAHGMGIVHRDIKPANLFLVEGAGAVFVKLLDFGVAKRRDVDQNLTMSGALMGTPFYMSPEQFEAPRLVDPRIDLWALAVVAYACITGAVPFQGESVGALAIAIHERRYTRLGQARPDLGPAVEAWFERAFERDPAARFQSGAELAESLRAAFETRSPPVAPRKRRRGILIGAAALLLVGGAAAAGLWMVRPRAAKPKHRISSATASAGAPDLCSAMTPDACLVLGRASSAAPAMNADEQKRAFEAFSVACEAGNAEGCGRLGQMLAKGRGAPKDEARAVSLFDKACEKGHADACADLGRAYANGAGVAKDAAKGAARLETSCNGGALVACTYLGVLMKGTESYERARQLFERSCNGGFSGGCIELAGLYEKGRGVEKSAKRAFDLLQRACDGGDPLACGYAGGHYDAGDVVPKDSARAATLYGLACDAGGGGACHRLGTMLDRGEGVAKDEPRAVTLFRFGCDEGLATCCVNLAVMLHFGKGGPIDLPGAAALYQRGCDGGEPMGCSNLGVLYAEGKGVTQDLGKAAELARRACDAGVGEGCFSLGSAYEEGRGVVIDPSRSVALYRRSCELGTGAGCESIGFVYLKGIGVGKDPARAAELWRESCSRGIMTGCMWLGTLYQRGEGVKRDLERTRGLYDLACKGGLAQACERLRDLH